MASIVFWQFREKSGIGMENGKISDSQKNHRDNDENRSNIKKKIVHVFFLRDILLYYIHYEGEILEFYENKV
jgi:hypothetical protein